MLLSICIPTFNRAQKLKQCLDNIVLQFSDNNIENCVEVIISDNASQDGTEELVKEYQEKFANIKYFRNETNIGVDENIINSVVKANGQYCWHIGDDDLLRNGSLKFATELLKKKRLSLLSLNFFPYIDIEKSKENIEIEEYNNIEYSNSSEEFYLKGYCQGILGIFIFDKEMWLKTDRKNYEKFWGYYEIILKMIGHSTLPLAYVKTPMIYIGQDYRWNKGGTALSILIHNKRFISSLEAHGYSKEFVEKDMDRVAKNLLITVLSAKSFGLKCSLKNLSLIYKEFYEYPAELALTTAIYFLPNSLIKLAKSARANFKKNV